MRRFMIGVLSFLIVACRGDQPLLGPTKSMITILVGQASLVDNPSVPSSGVNVMQFTFTIKLNGKILTQMTAGQLPWVGSIPKPTEATEYEVEVSGPADFELVRECENPDASNTVRCGAQLVDLRPLCDPSVFDYIWLPDRIVWESKCKGLVIRVEEVSPSDEDDGDLETHGPGSGKFHKIATNDPNRWITVEAICMGRTAIIKNAVSKPLCEKFQASYRGPARNLSFAPVGSFVALIGPTGWDRNHNMHYEGHGPTYIFPIPADPYYPSNPDFSSNSRR